MRASSVLLLVSVTDSHHYGVAALSPGAGRRRRHGGPRLVELARRHARRGRQASAARNQSHRRGVSARDRRSLLIDMSLSEVARGKLVMAAKDGRPIPLGWALDAERQSRPLMRGQASTAACWPWAGPRARCWHSSSSSWSPRSPARRLGFEASTLFVDEGNRPRLGHAFLVIDPGALSGRGCTTSGSKR